MEIKLSIKSQALTRRQKGTIVEKLEEIKAIIKEKSRAEKIDEYFSKLGYENEKEDRQWLTKQFVPHYPLQKQNGTLPQTNLYYERKPEKEFPTGSEDFLRGQAPQNERQKAKLNATLEDLKEECRLLGEVLGKGFHLGCKCSQELKNPQLSVSMPFLSQVATFQGLVSRFLDCYQDTNCNKI